MIRDALKAIRDDLKIGEYETIPKPLLSLIQAYNELLLTDKDLPVIDKDTSGEMLKDYIEALDVEKRIELLHLYLTNAKVDPDTEREIERAEKEDQRFLSRLVTQATVGITIAFFIGFIVYVTKTQDLTKLKNGMLDIFNVIVNQKDKNA